MARAPKPPAEAASEAQPPAKAEAKYPAKVRLTSLHGFIDEDDRHRTWQEGDVVSDPSEVKLLTDRGAPVVEHQD